MIFRKNKKQRTEDHINKLNKTYFDKRAHVITGWNGVKDTNNIADLRNYEKICMDNIRQFYSWIQAAEKQSGFKRPTQADAFKYLAMLYEKQERFQEAVAVCQDAISVGITDDGTKGGMPARLERMSRKLSTAK